MMSRYSSRYTTSDFFRIDVRYLQRKGMLSPGRSSRLWWTRANKECGSIGILAGDCEVVLKYRHCRYGEDWQDKNYSVGVEWTPCNYGGQRAWFRCPAAGCGRRVAVLYCGGVFACRQCYQLAYESQREAAWDRALRRAQAIRMKLGGSGSLAEDFPRRPKGMHRRTYLRLLLAAEQAEGRSWSSPLIRRLLSRGLCSMD